MKTDQKDLSDNALERPDDLLLKRTGTSAKIKPERTALIRHSV